MDTMLAGLTKADAGMGIAWNILGQTYRPLQHGVGSMAWHATLPQGTFVPPHIHPTQDEFVYMLTGALEFELGEAPQKAAPGDLARLPMGLAHGIFNRSAADATCLFWVAPTGMLWDLFVALDGVPDPAEVVRLAALHEVNFLPPPG